MRNMGGIYFYSFDVTVMLFGVCFNLAGLPYSAGFLGKEFLLFQILKNDFLSYIVRACWSVSFFFTPVYMFLLVFVVFFGPKKSFFHTYSNFWNFLFDSVTPTYINFLRRRTSRYNLEFHSTLAYQFTIVTSRPTSYILFFF